MRRARPARLAERVGARKSCETEGEVGEGIVGGVAGGDEEGRGGGGDGVAGVDLVGLLGRGSIGTARGAERDIVRAAWESERFIEEASGITHIWMTQGRMNRLRPLKDLIVPKRCSRYWRREG